MERPFGGASTANPIPVPPTTCSDDDMYAKVVIGNNASHVTTKGLRVLNNSNKAMILPKMDSPYLYIVNPVLGMTIYDTYDRQLAIFNRTQLSFWK